MANVSNVTVVMELKRLYAQIVPAANLSHAINVMDTVNTLNLLVIRAMGVGLTTVPLATGTDINLAYGVMARAIWVI